MYTVKEKSRITLLDDVGFTTYTEGDSRTIYLPKEVFVARIGTLKNKPINFEHEEGVEPRGGVIDVVHNLEGIKTFEDNILPADGEYYAVLKIKDEFQDEADKISSISTEFRYIKKVLKPDLTTSPYTKTVVYDDGTIDGTEFDIYCVDIEYVGLALTNNPKRTRLKEKVYNSNNIEKKLLDKDINTIKINEFLNLPMESAEEKLKEIAKNTYSEMIKNSEEEAKQKEEADNQLKEKIANVIDAILPDKIKNALEAYAKEKEQNSEKEENSEEEEKEKKEENSEKEEKEGEKNSANYVASQFAKAAQTVKGEKNSNIAEPIDWHAKIKII
jgi:hypothetical protein